jgi:O-antigen ligase
VGSERDLVITKLQTLQEWLLVAYAVSLPLSMTASWALLIAGLISWAVESAVRKFVKTDHEHPVFVSTPLPLVPQICALVLAVGVSGLMNGGSHVDFKEAWHCVSSLKGMLVYFWASKVFHFHPAAARTCFQSLLCVSAVAGIWGAIQQIFNFHPFGYQYLQGTGFLAGPMAFAGQMQLFGLMALALLLTKAHTHFSGLLANRYFFAAIVVANLLGIVFAGERSAWLGALAGIMVLTAMVSWRVFFKAAVVLMVIATLSFYSVPLVKTRVTSMFSAQDVSTQARLKVWTEALRLWQSSPAFGVGFLNFPHIDIPEAIVPGVSKDLNHAHSNYLQFLATTGIVGEFAYLWLCISIIMKSAKAYVRARTEKDDPAAGFYCGTLAGMVSLMVAGLFEYNFGTAQVRLAQWFVLALLSYEAVKPPHQQTGTGPRDTVPDSLPSV